MKIGFDNNKYVSMQSQHIKERIKKFGDKLYLEFGGKLYDDNHASRVLPGFEPDSKLKMLMQLKDQVEVIIVVNANDIESNKMRGDLGISYDEDALRLVDAFSQVGLYVGSICITRYAGQASADKYINRLTELGIRTYKHYNIPGYPSDVATIVSDDGYGKNDYIETQKPLVVVTAPGPGSGKMAVCLSQLYHENKRGIKAGYSKFETFPIWNLPLKHPVNMAYEAATADLNDVNMIDHYHLEAYGETTVNYNRDVEIFPVLNAIFTEILGSSPYKSPTDMGVNMVGKCIIDDEACCDASKREIIRRYYQCLCDKKRGKDVKDILYKLKLIMKQANLSVDDRVTVEAALTREKNTGLPATSIELPNGTLVTGKTTDLLGASAAVILNALKELAGIDHELDLVSHEAIEPIKQLKTNILEIENPRLHVNEILIALSISSVSDQKAKLALQQLPKLKGCEAHSSVLLSSVDENVLKKLGLNLTCEPKYELDNNKYHKR